MAIERMLRRTREWLRKRDWFLRSNRFGYPPTAPDAPSSIDALSCFQQLIGAMEIKAAVEFGTAQGVPGRSTHMLGLFPKLERSNYTMVDIKSGPDVDVVADLHSLPLEWSSRYDACIANAVFEHLDRPWIAAKEIARILAPGGVCYISTHQTFPLHGYPKDFFRFSTDALSIIFSDAGLEVLSVGYAHRTKITLPLELLAAPHLDAWNKEFPSYALVTITCRKP